MTSAVVTEEAAEIAAAAWARSESAPFYVPWPLLLGAVFVIAIVREYIGGRDATAAI